MPITIFNFQETVLQPYTFNPTMDERVVSAIVLWSLYGKRYYLRMNELGGEPIFMLPLIGSVVGFHILSITWLRGIVTVTTSFPHNFPVGNTMNLTLRGCFPDAYNGTHQTYVSSPRELQFNLASFPGLALVFGFISYDINIGAGYFDTSTIVYRTANKQFEVSP